MDHLAFQGDYPVGMKYRRYGRLVSHSKRSQVAVTAVARGLCGFVWGLMAA